ncbi:MAG: putative bifunctional diguanylate cyclase/phosphodiesterase [Thermoleophilaceae bacterium]
MTQEALTGARHRQELERFFELSANLFTVTDENGVFLMVNPAVRELLGYEPEELKGLVCLDLVHPEDHAMAAEQSRVLRAESGCARMFEARYRAKDGSYRWLQWTARSDPRTGHVFGVAQDVTELHESRAALSESEHRYRRLVETSNDLIWELDPDGRVLFVNEAVLQTHGYAPDEVVGHLWTEYVAPEDRETGWSFFDTLRAGFPAYNVQVSHIRRDGSRVVLNLNGAPLKDPEGRVTSITGTATDITERRRFEHELRFLADHDPLTGLINRRRFEDEVEHEIARDARYGDGGALLVLDLDNFKYINDTLGHNVGDEVLISVAGSLGRHLRDADVYARLGGDEFAALLPATSLEQADVVAAKLSRCIREEPLIVGGQPLRMTTSVGITCFRGRDVTARELLGEADLAMYEAKEAGRDRTAHYSAEGHARMHERMTWVDRIRRALEDDGFVLEAQPILNLHSGEVSQYELLVRMVSDDGAIVPPGAFLPTAERFGLVEQIDRWVVQKAIELIRSHADRGRELKLEVNLSGRSFGDPELREFIERAVRESGIAPNRLVFEITETAAIASLEQARSLATRLGELGCLFALDDFGTGFGSFHYLKYLPIDYVKLDGDFIRDLAHSHDDQVLVRAMADVAHGLGMQTIAEFVESEDILEKLREFGVDYAQGFHIGRPAPVSELG